MYLFSQNTAGLVYTPSSKNNLNTYTKYDEGNVAFF